jgi:hypothetical protein
LVFWLVDPAKFGAVIGGVRRCQSQLSRFDGRVGVPPFT